MAPFTGPVPPVNGALSYRGSLVHLQARASVPPLLGRRDRWRSIEAARAVRRRERDGGRRGVAFTTARSITRGTSLRSRIELRERRVGEADTFAGASITPPS